MSRVVLLRRASTLITACDPHWLMAFWLKVTWWKVTSVRDPGRKGHNLWPMNFVWWHLCAIFVICVQSLTSVCDQFLYLRYIAVANSTAASNVLASHLPNLFRDGVSFDWFGFTYNLLIISQLMASLEGGCNELYLIFFFVLLSVWGLFRIWLT